MIDSSSIRVHQHAANGQKKQSDPIAKGARVAALRQMFERPGRCR